MRIADEVAGEILVERDSTRSSVELHIKAKVGEDYHLIRLDLPEARRLSALILFQAGRLERLRTMRGIDRAEPELKSA